MTPNNRSLALAALFLAGTAVPRAEASLTQAATFDEKVENAAAIVVGKVIRQESRFDPSKRWILTYTTLRVEKALKGAAPSEVTLVTPGGAVDGIYQSTVGVPVFEEGQENVVFVRNTAQGPTVLYLDQGAYEIQRQHGGDRVVAPVRSDAIRIDAQRGLAVSPEEPRTLREFEEAVRAAERRTRFNRMEMLQRQRAEQQPSIWQSVAENKALIFVALAGIALATIHFLRRS